MVVVPVSLAAVAQWECPAAVDLWGCLEAVVPVVEGAEPVDSVASLPAGPLEMAGVLRRIIL